MHELRVPLFARHLDALLLAAVLLAGVAGCSEPVVPGGEITVKNDIQDREYNVVEFTTTEGRPGINKRLRPGEKVTLPSGVTGLSFSRRYRDMSREYRVSCPSPFNKRVTIKLIDVHTNRLPGGCQLTRRGEGRYGNIVWEDSKKKR